MEKLQNLLLITLSFRFIKLFDYKDLANGGEMAYVLSNLEISAQIIIKTYKDMTAKTKEQEALKESESSILTKSTAAINSSEATQPVTSSKK